MHNAAVLLLAIVLAVVPARPAYGSSVLPADAPTVELRQTVLRTSVPRVAGLRTAGPQAGVPGTVVPRATDLQRVRHQTDGSRAAERERSGLRADAPEPDPGYRSPVGSVFLPEGVAAPFDPPRSRWGAGHRGVDLEAAVGDPVLAPGPGTVTFAGDVAGRGVVVVRHADGLRSTLEPVATEVSVGSRVRRGDVVGTVEHTAANHCAPETCVHWGVRRGDRYVDPLTLVHRPLIVLLPDE